MCISALNWPGWTTNGSIREKLENRIKILSINIYYLTANFQRDTGISNIDVSDDFDTAGFQDDIGISNNGVGDKIDTADIEGGFSSNII